MNIVVKMKFGSHLYGTTTPESDLDLKGVYIPEARDLLLGRVQKVVQQNTKTDSSQKNSADDIDVEFFSLQHYLKLLGDGQAVCLDMLFAPDEMILESTGLWETLRVNRHLLISRNAKPFIGYCMQQASKYGIRGSRVAAVRSVIDELCELVETGEVKVGHKLSEIRPRLEALAQTSEFINLIEIKDKAGTVATHLECCNRKTPLTATVKTAIDIYDRVFAEYGQRALAAEKNENIDWKAMSHAVRVASQGIELLSTGNITFPLPNVERVLAIKRGLIPYQEVADEIESLLPVLEQAARDSNLRETPHSEFIEDLLVHIHTRAVLNG